MNVARPGDSNTPQDWWRDLPVVTKYWLTSTILSTLVCHFGLTSVSNFALYWPFVWEKFQVWRLLGCAIYAGGFSFPYFFHVMMLYRTSEQYETNAYNTGAGGTSADYLWLMTFSLLSFYLISGVFSMSFLSESLLFTIMYVSSRRNADGMSNFYGIKFKTLYVPWVNVAFKLLMGHGIMLAIIGIAVGHLYYFLVEVMPPLHGITLIKTPKWCFSVVEYASGRSSRPVVTAVPPRTRPADGTAAGNRGTYNWGGGGRALGTRN